MERKQKEKDLGHSFLEVEAKQVNEKKHIYD
jgi:hypothetical protein